MVTTRRVLFDDRAAQRTGTGIPRYAQLVSSLVAEGLPGVDVSLLSDLIEADSPVDEELLLPALLEREGVDVYHSPLFRLPAVMPARTQAVVTVHDAIPTVRPDLATPSFAALFAAEAQGAAHRAALVVCPSEHARSEVAAALDLPLRRVCVVPEAPDTNFSPADQESVRRTCERHGLEPGRYLLAVGSVEARKGPDLILEALARLQTSSPWLRCAFAGPAAGYALAEEAARIGVAEKVVALGHVPDEVLAALYTGSLALVFPSRHEGFGLPVVEAFACGAPVVAARATSIQEVAGDAALLVPTEDPIALAEAIRRLIDEPALHAELRVRGRTRLAERFTPAHVRSALAALYAEILPRHEVLA